MLHQLRYEAKICIRCKSKIAYYYINISLICLELAICALNWSMGMVVAGANSFNFSLSIGLLLDKLNVFQILKLVGLCFGIFRLADFRAT